jgi:uncharacterized membrane protein
MNNFFYDLFDLNYGHFHIVLNHFPTIGTVLGLALFLYALLRKHDELKEISLVIFMVMAILGIPTFITGAAAERAITARSDVALVEVHKDAAVLAFTFLAITGTFAWLGLWQSRRFKRAAGWNQMVVLVLSVVTVALMIRTGTMGGEISHTEIRPEGAVIAAEAEVGLNGTLEAWVLDNAWVWPTGETLHFTGMALLFGVMLVINLRLVGLLRKLPFKAMHRLLPVGIFAFGISLTTGMMLFNANPTRYIAVPTFFLKMFLVALAGIAVLYVTIFDETWNLGPDDNPPLSAKAFAVVTTIMWLGVLYYGRMIPFLE